jgi:hypothetical protein
MQMPLRAYAPALLGACLSALFVSNSLAQTNSVRAFPAPDETGYDTPPRLLRCAEWPVPRQGGAAVWLEFAIGSDGRLAEGDSIALVRPHRWGPAPPLPPAIYVDKARRIASTCVFQPARKDQVAVPSRVQLYVSFPAALN